MRQSMINAVQHCKAYAEEVTDQARRLGVVIQQLEGGVHVLQTPDGSTQAQQVSLHHTLSQQGVWVSFGHPNLQKSLLRTSNCWCVIS